MKCNVTYVNEESSVIFSLAFTDGNGVSFGAESIKEIRFQVCDDSGNVINKRSFANGLITTNQIVLTGNDLTIGDNGTVRLLGIKAIYDSDAGANLSATFEEKFVINNLKNIT